MKKKYFLYTLFFVLLGANVVLYFYLSGDLKLPSCGNQTISNTKPAPVVGDTNANNNLDSPAAKSDFPPLWPEVEWNGPIIQKYSPFKDNYEKEIDSKYYEAVGVDKETTQAFTNYYELLLKKLGWNNSGRADAPTVHSSFIEYQKNNKYINFGYMPTEPDQTYLLQVIYAELGD